MALTNWTLYGFGGSTRNRIGCIVRVLRIVDVLRLPLQRRWIRDKKLEGFLRWFPLKLTKQAVDDDLQVSSPMPVTV